MVQTMSLRLDLNQVAEMRQAWALKPAPKEVSHQSAVGDGWS